MTIRIKNWSLYQHYKNRKPPWIRLYRELLDDPDFHALSGDEAKTLIKLWLIASEDPAKEGNLPKMKDAAFRCRMSEEELGQCIQGLSHWLETDDSMTLASCKHHASVGSGGCLQDACNMLASESESESESEGERDLTRSLISNSKSNDLRSDSVFDKDNDLLALKKQSLPSCREEIENSAMSPRAKKFVDTLISLWQGYEAAHAVSTFQSVMPLMRKWKEGRDIKVLQESRARWPNDRPIYVGGLNKLHPYLVRTFQNEPEEERSERKTETKVDIRPRLNDLVRRLREDEMIDANAFQTLINTAIDDNIELPNDVRNFIDKLESLGLIEFTANSEKSGSKTRIYSLGWEGPRLRSELYKGGPKYCSPEEVSKIIQEVKGKLGKL